MKLLKIMVLALAVASIAAAAPIIGLFSTGLGTIGGAESNWQVNGGTAYITQDGQFPIPPWTANTADSRWISPNANYNGVSDTPSTMFSYTLQFDLTGFDHTTASFSYAVAADDYINSVVLNSTSLGGFGSSFTGLNGPFTANSGFVAGLNTITVTVPNSSSTSGNPNGMRFEVLDSNVEEAVNPIPEPSTFALVGLALAAIPAIRRRRR